MQVCSLACAGEQEGALPWPCGRHTGPGKRTKQRTYGVEGNSGGPLENGSWVPTSVYTPKSGANGSNVSVRKKKKKITKE